MKKLIILLTAALLVSACTASTKEEQRKTHSEYIQRCTELVDLSFNGTTHEFIYMSNGYKGSIEHWPDCKYCKQKNNNEQSEYYRCW